MHINSDPTCTGIWGVLTDRPLSLRQIEALSEAVPAACSTVADRLVAQLAEHQRGLLRLREGLEQLKTGLANQTAESELALERELTLG